MPLKIEKRSLFYGVALLSAFVFALYVRVALPYTAVFYDNGLVRFGGNDPWYHMRLVENMLMHMPHRIWYDPMTFYPHGADVTYPPLFDWVLASFIWLVGLGNPFVTLGQHGIETIAAWYPAVLGALTIVPVYFIGKHLWNRNAGVLSAVLIAMMPGQFLMRTLLGFTDHHAMETLLSTVTMLFFLIAVKTAKENEITFGMVKNKDWLKLKKPMTYTAFAGIAFGSYFVAWMGAPLFIFVLIVFAIMQFTIEHLRDESTDYLCMVFIPAFLIALVMVLPIPCMGALNGIPVLSLFIGMVVFFGLHMLSYKMKLRGESLSPAAYPLLLAFGLVGFLAFLNISSLPIVKLIQNGLAIFVPSTSSLTIAEVHPMYLLQPYTNSLFQGNAWQWFKTTFFFSAIAYPVIMYDSIRKYRAEIFLFLVWSIVILFACLSQNRFAAYYAVNVALLSGFLTARIVEYLQHNEVVANNSVHKGGMNKKYRMQQKNKHNNDRYIYVVLAGIAIAMFVFYPVLNTTLSAAKQTGGPDGNWIESLEWLRNNTPEPGVDYYGLYERPENCTTTFGSLVSGYSYPSSAYSVMSWWDYGHWIERIGRRIPVANPFQQGIGGIYKRNRIGASLFFIAKDEASANRIADELDVKYVITDFMMADAFNAFYNKFGAMCVWADDAAGYYTTIDTPEGKRTVPSLKYFTTIVARLHIFDGSGIDNNGEMIIPALQHYRLVHESPSTILTLGGREIKYVKVFEYVEGEVVSGSAPSGALVTLTINVTTNTGREFTYTQQTIATGTYSFTVPYTEGINGDVVAGHVKIDVNY